MKRIFVVGRGIVVLGALVAGFSGAIYCGIMAIGLDRVMSASNWLENLL